MDAASANRRRVAMLLHRRLDLAAAVVRHHRLYLVVHWAVTAALAIALLAGQWPGGSAHGSHQVCQDPRSLTAPEEVGVGVADQHPSGGTVAVLDARNGRLLCS